MLKKSVLIGSLVAGAFLLPSLAVAGVVSGTCVTCHTMHDSQNGAAVNVGGPQDALLKGAGCVGCHATGVGNDPTTGLANSGIPAPQVNGINTGSGGFFAAAGADAAQHNVVGIKTSDVDLVNTPPGNGGTPLASQLTCANCHSRSGHHSVTPNTYRMLAVDNTGTGSLDYGQTGVAGVINRMENTYDAAGMNGLCAQCHGGFHAGNQTGSIPGENWIRHPTDVAMVTSAAFPSIVNAYAGSNETPVGTGNTVMCISCHYAHGSNQADLLAFNYAAVLAGDASAATGGCENCHSYTGTGM